jgi:tRNA threonylcarbamoyladenosine biosynthesis protein TsaB
VLILSLDTTSRGGSVAIVDGGDVVCLRGGDPARTHGERLPMDLASACEAAGVRIGDIDLFAVAAGPGSFTGLRIGIATVQGLAMARNRRVVPVSALEAVAAAAGAGPGVAGPRAARIAAWIDALRGEVFAQVFEASGPISEVVAAAPLTVVASHRGILDGAEFHGDGAVRYREEILAAIGGPVRVAEDVPLLAGAIGLIAARQPDRAVLPHAVVPLYVRRPDAEIARGRERAAER